MPRELAGTTKKKLRSALESERERLSNLIAEHVQEREEARLTETSAERSADPASAEAGSMAFEYEKELSIEQNSVDLPRARMDAGLYGTCESCGQRIPVAHLEVLPYATLCVTCAAKR